MVGVEVDDVPELSEAWVGAGFKLVPWLLLMLVA